MNFAHVHLLLNHIPVIGIVIGFLLLSFAIAKKSDDLIKASLGVFILVALIAIPTYLTGEPAEKVIEHLPGVSEQIIDEHEDSAIVSLLSAGVLGIMALAGLILSRRSRFIPRWHITVSWILSVIVVGMMAYTANLGGQIRHTETRSDFQSPAPAGKTQTNTQPGSESDEREHH
jgi:hypothetical protein